MKEFSGSHTKTKRGTFNSCSPSHTHSKACTAPRYQPKPRNLIHFQTVSKPAVWSFSVIISIMRFLKVPFKYYLDHGKYPSSRSKAKVRYSLYSLHHVGQVHLSSRHDPSSNDRFPWVYLNKQFVNRQDTLFKLSSRYFNGQVSEHYEGCL